MQWLTLTVKNFHSHCHCKSLEVWIPLKCYRSRTISDPWYEYRKIKSSRPSSSLLKDLHEVLLKLRWSSCEFRPCSEVYEWAEPVWLLSLCPLWASSAILAAHRPDALIMTEKGPASETAKQHGYKQTDRSYVCHVFTLLLMDQTCHWLLPHPVSQSLSSRLKLLPLRSALCQLILQTW